MGVEWLEHEGKRVLFTDHRDCSSKQVIENLDTQLEMVQEIPPPTKILILTNAEGAVLDTAAMTRSKAIGSEIEARIEKHAIVGIHGIRNILLAAYNRVTGAGKHQKLFDNHEEALDWLTS